MNRKMLLIVSAAIITALTVVFIILFFQKKPENVPSHKRHFDLESSGFDFAAGVNINGLEGSNSAKYTLNLLTDKKNFDDIVYQGFDHVRIPVDFRLAYSWETKELDESFMKKFDKILDYAEQAGLYATIDFHGWYDIDSDIPEHKETFLTIWDLVATRYKDRSHLISFELMNEPSYATMPEHKLNALQAEAISVIRKTNPERLIICACPDGNQPWLLSKVTLPEGDENLAVAVHIYHPANFTHQGFEWANPPREKGKQERLTEEGMGELNWNLGEIKKFKDDTGIPVILNEFGVNLVLAEDEDTALYLSTITRFCKDNGIPWTYWCCYNGEMALCHYGKWDDNSLDALFLK